MESTNPNYSKSYNPNANYARSRKPHPPLAPSHSTHNSSAYAGYQTEQMQGSLCDDGAPSGLVYDSLSLRVSRTGDGDDINSLNGEGRSGQRYQSSTSYARPFSSLSQNIHTQPLDRAKSFNIDAVAQSDTSWPRTIPAHHMSAQTSEGYQHKTQYRQVAPVKNFQVKLDTKFHQNANQDQSSAKYKSSRSTSPLQNDTYKSYRSTALTMEQSQQQQPVFCEPTGPVTVYPCEVYDPYAEYQRRAQLAESESEMKSQAEKRSTGLREASTNADGKPEDLEVQMREMFKKMRELNAKNPQMLSKLWQQEIDQYLSETARENLVQIPGMKSALNSVSAPTQTSAQLLGQGITVNESSNAQQYPPAPTPITSTSISGIGNEKSLWDPEKKAKVAAIAVKLLHAMPENRNKTVTVAEISNILSGSPTYLGLCQQIQALGLFIDKQKFAHGILTAVPEANKYRQNTIAMIRPINGESANLIINQVENNAKTPESPIAEAEPPLDGEPIRDTSKKQYSQPQKLHASERAEEVKEKSNTVQGPHSSALVNGCLEGLEAIKSFNECVAKHLQQPANQSQVLNPGSHNRRPSKSGNHYPSLTKEQMARKRQFKDLLESTVEISDDDEDIERPFKVAKWKAGYEVNPPLGLNKSTMVDKYGQTGHQRPLENTGDVQISPPADLPMRQAPASQTCPTRSLEVLAQLDTRKALRRNSYDPRTIARDVLLASGRHPEMRQLNAHLEPLRKNLHFVENYSDLSKFNWDLVDPGGGPPGSGTILEVRPDNVVDIDSDNDSVLGASNTVTQVIGTGDTGLERVYGSLPATAKKFKRKSMVMSEKNGPTPRGNMLSSTQTPHGIGDEQPRGQSSNSRPIGNRDSRQPRDIHAGNLSRDKIIESTNPTENQSTPTPIVSGYAALRAAQKAEGVESPRRGRPVGWRKFMQKQGAAGLKKMEEPAKVLKPPQEPEPIYSIYECEWQSCNAHLHNLNTLRKHLHKLHRIKDVDSHYQCLWAGCGGVTTETNAVGTTAKARFRRLAFGDQHEWARHIENTHLKPIAWKLGDGPAGGLSERRDSDLSEAYMSDSQGRRVTPQVIIPVSPSRNTRLAGPAGELQLALERKKRAIGPGIDRGGARLANEKRRQGFIDDDDTTEVIEDD